MVRRLIAMVACVGGAAGAAGCVDGFDGANVQIDFSPYTPPQAPEGMAPQVFEVPANASFGLYRVDTIDGTDVPTQIQRFEIHHIVDPSSPCFIDVGEHVPFPGLHVTQFATKMAMRTGITDIANPPPTASEQDRIDAATAVQRMANVMALASPMGIKVVTTASTTTYPPVDADCTGTGLPPPTCLDDTANERRLRICLGVWQDDPAKFEGTDRVLTAPLSGTTFGFVPGLNPINMSPVGGAAFFVTDSLDAPSPDAYLMTFDIDGAGVAGSPFLYGFPERTTRGVTHVRMGSPTMQPMQGAVLAVFAGIGEDDTGF